MRYTWQKLHELTNFQHKPSLTQADNGKEGCIMKTVWKLQDAKSRFSKAVEDAVTIRPQYITRRGVEAVVVVSHREYEELTSNILGFKDFLLKRRDGGDSYVLN